MKHGEWTDLWRRLATRDQMSGSTGEARMVERWRDLANRLDAGTGQRPDPVFDFVLSRLEPGMTVLDVGAGVGRWTIPLAELGFAVTVVEPSEGMRQVLEERLVARDLGNVTIVGESWPEAAVGVHDVAVAAYSMYTSPDLAAFARAMDQRARRLCCMAMRLPAQDGVIGDLSERIHGECHDSPNFIVGYNAMLEAGFTPNVFIEPSPVRYWTDDSLDDALLRAKRHLGLGDEQWDGLIADTLRRRLQRTDDGYRWPDWMRAAVVWWEPL